MVWSVATCLSAVIEVVVTHAASIMVDLAPKGVRRISPITLRQTVSENMFEITIITIVINVEFKYKAMIHG